jgi:hypothetical protein
VGNFYGNVTLLDVTREDLRAVEGLVAFIAVEGNDIVVCAERDDPVPTSGAVLSASLDCTALSIGVHDDDILFWEVHAHGQPIASGALPDPRQYFAVDAEMLELTDPSLVGLTDEPTQAGTHDLARLLVDAIGRGDPVAVQAALDADFTFATERHDALTNAARLPQAAVGWGFRYLSDERVARPAAFEALDT